MIANTLVLIVSLPYSVGSETKEEGQEEGDDGAGEHIFWAGPARHTRRGHGCLYGRQGVCVLTGFSFVLSHHRRSPVHTTQHCMACTCTVIAKRVNSVLQYFLISSYDRACRP